METDFENRTISNKGVDALTESMVILPFISPKHRGLSNVIPCTTGGASFCITLASSVSVHPAGVLTRRV